ncbi:MAG: tRNA (adenosine(37)-N6)-threonylcarbamoyltransferase complex transferase subunit TsaD [Candidatus Paceibacterota bacterium]
MRILSIETSCDETGIALLNIEGDLDNINLKIKKELLATQFETHRPFGGVVPGLARREHEKNLPLLTKELEVKEKDVDLITVTVGPGLDPCLWTGINFVKELQAEKFSNTEVVGVNHMEGHLYSFLLSEDLESIEDIFPAIQLVVSGGHTMVVLMKSLTQWEVLGETRDDAAGEAFDKVARMLGLEYPGGPEISKFAENGDSQTVDFPRPMINSGDYDFSFSGLKTAVLYYLKDNFKEIESSDLKFDIPRDKKADISASFQKAIIDTLVSKTFRAVEEFNAKSVMVSGGVAANTLLQESLKNKSKEKNKNFFVAPARYNTDNGVMIGLAGYINFLSGNSHKIESQPNLSL